MNYEIKYKEFELEYYGVGAGWWQILDKMFDEIKAVKSKSFLKTCFKDFYIKEKFGGLRISGVVIDDPLVCKAVSKAEEDSLVTCEICGNPGKSQMWTTYWIKTCCDECIGKKHAQK
jgi:hypothetical protein